MLFDLINFGKLRRAARYAVLLVLCLGIQNLVFSRISPLGVRPMFIPCAVVAVGVFSGGISGGIFGLIAGIFLDMAHVETLVLFTILFPLIGYAAGIVTELFLNRRFFSYFIFSAAALVICAFLQCFDFLFFANTDRLGVLFVALLQVFWSLPFTFAIYFPCRAFSKK